jgi:hypothetical protein
VALLRGFDGKIRCATLIAHNTGIQDRASLVAARAAWGSERSSRRSSALAPWWRFRSTVRGRNLGTGAAGIDALFVHRPPRS